MTVIRDAWKCAETDDLPTGGVGTIGNYDGVHRGQRAILDRVVERAQKLACGSLVVTFEPHPLALLRPADAPRRLTTPVQKERLLRDCGVDHVLVVDFDQSFSRTSAKEFAERFLFGRLGLAEVYVGSRFTFGRDRKGDLSLLQKVAAAQGCRVAGVAEVLHEGEPVSSTRIRRAIRSGRVELAAELLGRPYAVGGRVERGAGKGHEIGWPTINLRIENELLPADGVYVSQARLEPGKELLQAVTNIGVRPTIHDDAETTVESHILDLNEDLYGRRVELSFHVRLRGERRFASVDELTEQIAHDVQQTRDFAASGGLESVQ